MNGTSGVAPWLVARAKPNARGVKAPRQALIWYVWTKGHLTVEWAQRTPENRTWPCALDWQGAESSSSSDEDKDEEDERSPGKGAFCDFFLKATSFFALVAARRCSRVKAGLLLESSFSSFEDSSSDDTSSEHDASSFASRGSCGFVGVE